MSLLPVLISPALLVSDMEIVNPSGEAMARETGCGGAGLGLVRFQDYVSSRFPSYHGP